MTDREKIEIVADALADGETKYDDLVRWITVESDGTCSLGKDRYKVYSEEEHDAAAAEGIMERIDKLPKNFIEKFCGKKDPDYEKKMYSWVGNFHSFVLGMLYQRFASIGEWENFLNEAATTYSKHRFIAGEWLGEHTSLTTHTVGHVYWINARH